MIQQGTRTYYYPQLDLDAKNSPIKAIEEQQDEAQEVKKQIDHKNIQYHTIPSIILPTQLLSIAPTYISAPATYSQIFSFSKS